MRKNWKKTIYASILTTSVLSSTVLVAWANDQHTQQQESQWSKKEEKNPQENTYETKVPKYVFMFVGDGMSHVQTQMSNYYLDSLDQDTTAPLKKGNNILESSQKLCFMDFEAVGVTTTYDSTSFCPDSASTATSLATGKKTHSGTIGMDEACKTEYETIAEKVKKQLGYKVGVITSVTLNHATPAAYYAHNASRNNYYEIGEDLIESDFDYFAGGALGKVTGPDKDKKSLYDRAKEAGYKVVIENQKEAEALKPEDGKTIIVGEDTNGGALPYEMDREEGMWALKDYVSKGIEMLDNDKGFFMMVEGGKIDWACHANDAAAAIGDTIAFDEAVREAYNFYKKHPEETLIVVTGDHETGGMTIGYAGTAYDTFLANLENQKGSYDVFAEEYSKKYVEEKTPFETVLKDIEAFCGLTTKGDSIMTLTDYEKQLILDAYEVTVNGKKINKQEHGHLYGGYDPLTVTILHVMNNKAGVDFSSYSHTGVTVGTYAQGVGADLFSEYYDNTEIFTNLANILKVQ